MARGSVIAGQQADGHCFNSGEEGGSWVRGPARVLVRPLAGPPGSSGVVARRGRCRALARLQLRRSSRPRAGGPCHGVCAVSRDLRRWPCFRRAARRFLWPRHLGAERRLPGPSAWRADRPCPGPSRRCRACRPGAVLPRSSVAAGGGRQETCSGIPACRCEGAVRGRGGSI
jgi:hypothetical protein